MISLDDPWIFVMQIGCLSLRVNPVCLLGVLDDFAIIPLGYLVDTFSQQLRMFQRIQSAKFLSFPVRETFPGKNMANDE